MKKRIVAFILTLCVSVSLASFAVSAETDGYYTYTVIDGDAYITTVDEALSGDVVVPKTLGGYPVISIGEGAFRNCASIKSITIPEGIETVDYYVFNNCDSLESISIPSTVTFIGEGLFRECNKLVSITVDESNGTYHSVGNCIVSKAEHKLVAGCKTSVIPADGSVTVIGVNAFWGCEELADVTIPDYVTRIEAYAFYDCRALAEINIPENVKLIGAYAFSGCYNLENAYFENTEDWRTSLYTLSSAELENPETAARYLRSDYTNKWERISTLTFEIDGGEATLTDVYNFTEGDVVIPDSYDGYPVTAIGESAFAFCSDITSVTIPESVDFIGSYAFENCLALTDVYFASTEFWLTSLELVSPDELLESETAAAHLMQTYLIYDWERTDEINYFTYMINDEKAILTEVSQYISGDVTLPSTYDGYPVTGIGDMAFYGCDKLTGLTVPEGVEFIGYQAFWPCTALESISLPSTLKSIGENAFSGCYALSEININESNPVYHSAGNCLIETESKRLVLGSAGSVIPADGSVTAIGECAFENIKGLESIVIPSGVTTIEAYAFEGCENLTEISISESVTSISYGIFKACKKLESISVDEDNPAYRSEGNCLIETETKTLVAGCKSSIIPADGSVTTIGICAFDSSKIESVSIPDGVTHIESLAFYYCVSLSEITLPDSIVYIGNNAFDNTSYYHNEENWENGILYIDGHLIKASNTLSGICEIKEGTRMIAVSAFAFCEEISGVVIPESVTYINETAFVYCTELASVTFGNAKGWSTSHWSTGTVRMPQAELSSSALAAEYLTDTYCAASWSRADIEFVCGDADGDGALDANDAIYLLYSVFFGEQSYPVNQVCDFDGSGSVDANDAIYLLYHVFFGAQSYPLN